MNGIIRGVHPDGKLMIEMEDDKINMYDLKEIQLLY